MFKDRVRDTTTRSVSTVPSKTFLPPLAATALKGLSVVEVRRTSTASPPSLLSILSIASSRRSGTTTTAEEGATGKKETPGHGDPRVPLGRVHPPSGPGEKTKRHL